jgi:hypothetical protein
MPPSTIKESQLSLEEACAVFDKIPLTDRQKFGSGKRKFKK